METQPEICPARTEDAGQIIALQRLCYRGEAELYDDHTIPPLTQTLEVMKHDIVARRRSSSRAPGRRS